MTERELFEQALSIHDSSERRKFLDDACGGQAELRRQIEELLGADDDASRFFSEGAEPLTQTKPHSPLGVEGSVIVGKYKLLQLVGEGGMGSVWMADQTAPVKRRVAVKLIRPEREGSRSILARFEAERQAIALMDHPNIAKLLDAGTVETELGPAPFFVMELVKGVPLTEYCDAHKLDVAQRLKLFVQICSAVQHAHQKGIIHRDLKPSNILVESHDGAPVPKVIDFGLAKAMSGQPLTERTLFTALGAVAGTPLYMAPEQASFNAIDVDTRADVYALGVILYELLTGTTPIERETFKKAALDEVLRVIRESEPPTPSKRLSSTDSKPTVAANRHTEPEKLGRFVRGELDWIAMKALSKERDRRYETAASFAHDVERFLNHEPVSAGPPSVGYRLRKFVRRHRIQVVAAGLVLLAMLGGIAGTTWGLFRAETRRKEAELAKIDADKSKDRAEKAEAETLADYRAMTDEAVVHLIGSKTELNESERAFIEGALERWQSFAARRGDDAKSRELRAEGHYQVGTLWRHLGRYREAAAEHERAVGILEPLIAESGSEAGDVRMLLAKSRLALARALPQLGRLEETFEVLRRAEHEFESLRIEFPRNDNIRALLADVHLQFSYSNGRLAKHEDAAAYASKAVKAFGELAASHPSDAESQSRYAGALAKLADSDFQLGRRDEAASRLREAVVIHERLAKTHPRTSTYRFILANSLADLGIYLRRSGRTEESSKEMRRSIELHAQLANEYPSIAVHHASLANALTSRAVLSAQMGRHAEAQEGYREALSIRKRLVEQFPGVTQYQKEAAAAYNNYGASLIDLQKPAEAIAQFELALGIQEKLLKSDPELPELLFALAQTHANLSNSHHRLKRFKEALHHSQQSLKIKIDLAKRFPKAHVYRVELAMGRIGQGQTHFDAGGLADALAAFDDGIRLANELLREDPKEAQVKRSLFGAYSVRANIHHRMKNYSLALADAEEALRYGAAQNRPQRQRANLEAFRALYFLKVGRTQEAVAEADRLTKAGPWVDFAWYNFGCIYATAAKGDPNRRDLEDRAIECFREAFRAGFDDPKDWKADADLDHLRGREDFKKLMAEIQAKAASKTPATKTPSPMK